DPASERDAYVSTFAHASHPLDVMLVTGDGQAFAAIARDPTLTRPGVFHASNREMAYRAHRPLASYLAWAGSLGHPGWVPPALAAIYELGAGIAAGGCSLLPRRRGPAPAPGAWLAWAIVLRLRLHAWPWTASEGRLSAPFRGVAHAVPRWSNVGAAVASLVLLATIAAACLPRVRRDLLAAIVVAYVAF